ncbi:MAG: MBL fold metallo-hydrolase [Caldilineaceae bacterium]
MELRTHPVGDWQMNAYSLICPRTRASVLIDPGAEPEQLMRLVEGSQPVAILVTHSHTDHIGALEEMRRRLAIPVYAHDGPHANNVEFVKDSILRTGDTVKVGEYTLHVYEAPGHCDDQICFAVEGTPIVIVGDTIFAGGPGATRTSAAFKTTLSTLRNVVLSWPDESVCYPGHGSSFHLGKLRPAIEAFLAKDHGGFFGDADWQMA